MGKDGKTEVVDITIRHLCLHSEKWFRASQSFEQLRFTESKILVKKKLAVTFTIIERK